MWSKYQRRGAVQLFLRRLMMLGLLLIVLFAASGVWGVYQKERESRKLRSQAELEREDLLERQGRLAEGIETLQTDRGLEEALRQQYALAERGEQLIVIVDTPEATPAKASSTLEKWFGRFFWWW